jgi:hypothetical protein
MLKTIVAERPSVPVAVTLFAAFILGCTIAPSHAAVECSVPGVPSNPGRYCSCHGDEECNDMFSNYCKEGNGSCSGSGDTTYCTCALKANISKGNPHRHPILTPTRYPIHGGPGHGKPIRGMPIYGKPIVKGKPVQAAPGTGSNSSGSGNTILERSGGGGHGKR